MGIAVATSASCYPDGGGGTDPPPDTLYFPTGLAVSSGGNALYVVNSDFDLQWNGGTLQSYDLFAIRGDAAALIQTNLSGKAQSTLTLKLPYVNPVQTTPCAIGLPTTLSDAGAPTLSNSSDGSRIQLGQSCAPPMDTAIYRHDSAVIGAFATDLQLQTTEKLTPSRNFDSVVGTRLFAPVRGDATLTWADVSADDPTLVPDGDVMVSKTAGDPLAVGRSGVKTLDKSFFSLKCDQQTNDNQCDAKHRTGNVVDPGDTRNLLMPGEPFGMAQTPDGKAIAITHQTETDTSLLTAGVPGGADPSMQFIVDNVANGGKYIVAVPHDVDAPLPPCELFPPATSPLPPCVGPAFVQTNASSAELDLLRYFPDDNSNVKRPYLSREAIYPFNTNVSGVDSRGIVIDPTQRMACKVLGGPSQFASCARTPSRIFFANRDPATLVFASIGGNSPSVPGGYDEDLITFGANMTMLAGPSRVYLAPIVNLEGNYELRVFVVNFDSSTIQIFNPKNGANIAFIDLINVGPGPF
ncbi:MAG TPA: hypothetical protein VHV30_14215, partial [Polyangiaceae bacterium]|nr:hypothetical protein [Polyangiaceae bacterium]